MSMETGTVTDERVAHIADRMVGEGKRVSALAIWGEVRSGSIVAVSAALQRWREARQPDAEPAHASVMSGLPEDVAQTMLSAAGTMWASAREEAERVVNQRLAVAGQHADAIAGERDEALAAYQDRVAEAELAHERVATLTNALSISEDAVNRLATELPSLRDRAKAADERVAEVEQRAAAAQARVAQTEEREAASEARIAQAEERASTAEARVAQADERAAAAEARAAQAEERATAAEAHVAQADERAAAAEARVAQAEERATTAEARVAQAEERASTAETRLQAAEAALSEAHHAHEASSKASTAKDVEITRLVEERDAARHEATTLGEAGHAHAKEVQRWSDESNAASSRAQNAALQASESRSQLAALQAELDQARAELTAQREANAARHDETASQRGELERVQQELDASRDKLAAMSEANAAATAERSRLTQEASSAADRADAAERRATDLEHQLADLERAHAQRLEHAQEAAFAPESPSPEIESREAVMADELASLRRQIATQARTHEKSYGELRTLAEQWIAHAKELKQRLSATNQKVTFLDARSAAEVALLRRLSSELERLKPDHDLISRDAQQKLISATLAERLEQKGYRYDPATAVMSKIEA
ncbi:DNA-binding protein [Paraburkholderia sp. MPAMCS5]|uniref:DNA-binding protein n=1 Tax=Paraburkholderia sp. MPAMCS5 TaxID=3112563 RepID=UPI002E19143E|nr:DNA-binding protein [Paraburkholderia sp. MPAMCS5]